MNFKKRRIRAKASKIQEIFEKASLHESSSSVQFTQKPITPLKSSDLTNQTSQTSQTKQVYQSSQNKLPIAIILIGVALIGVLGFTIISLVKSLDFGSLIFSFGQDLKKDQYNKTNFLLIGTGGEGHDGANLTDTIIIASLDNQTKQVKMLSIPRDLYLDLPDTGGQRINKVYDTYLRRNGHDHAIKKLQETITTITGAEIQYYVKVDFNGFVKIIDSIGGVEVNVEKAINDPYYPKGDTIYYETFRLAAGLQTLDGETALKFARSRKTSSDFDRAKRQQQLLSAVKEKALSLDLLTNPSKLQNLYGSIDDSLQTNLSVPEILELAKIALEIDRDQINSRVINDQSASCGGFVYTPSRELFGGAAVLIPAGGSFKYINTFTKNYFNDDLTQSSDIQVVNGTRTAGLAGKYLNILQRNCFEIVGYGNAVDRDMKNTRILYWVDAEGNPPEDLKLIQEFIDAPAEPGIPEDYLNSIAKANTKIVIELGADYKQVAQEDPFDKLLYLGTPTTNKSTEENAENSTTGTANSTATNTSEEESITESPASETPSSEENSATESPTTESFETENN